MSSGRPFTGPPPARRIKLGSGVRRQDFAAVSARQAELTEVVMCDCRDGGQVDGVRVSSGDKR